MLSENILFYILNNRKQITISYYYIYIYIFVKLFFKTDVK